MLYSLKPNHEIKSEVIEDLLQISTQTIDEDIDRLLDQYSIFYKNSNYIYGSRVYDAAVEAVKFA
jgi:predicted transcriptional regulator